MKRYKYIKIEEVKSYGIAKVDGDFNISEIKDKKLFSIPNTIISYWYTPSSGCVKRMIRKKDTTSRWLGNFTNIIEITYTEYQTLKKEIMKDIGNKDIFPEKYLIKYKV